MPTTVEQAVEGAVAAEAAGFTHFGVPDSPRLSVGLFTALTACAAATARIRVGPLVTNPSLRHDSAVEAEFRALTQLGGRRIFLGVGAGDSAVRAVGIPAASAAQLQRFVAAVTANVPDIEIHVAAGGPRMATTAGEVASDILLGTGADRGSVEFLQAHAEQSAEQRGRPMPRVWLMLLTALADDEQGVAGARRALRSVVVAYARHALAGRSEASHVPAMLRMRLAEIFDQYDLSTHAALGEFAPNARLLQGSGARELERYLFNRFAAIGRAETVAAQVHSAVRHTGANNLWLPLHVYDPVGAIRRFGQDVLPALTATSGCAAG